MRTVSAIARYLAGVFLVFGLNGLLNFIPMPPPAGIADSSWVRFMLHTVCG